MEKKHKITVHTKYCIIFLMPLCVVIGAILFGCQNKEVKNVPVEKDTITKEQNTSKVISINNNNNSPADAPSPTKINDVELKNSTPIAEKKIRENKTSKPSQAKKEDSSLAAKSPSISNAEFPGGIEQFHNFFMKEYKKPESVNYWKLNFTLAFAIEKNGSVSFIECSPAVEEPLEKEIIRVLNLCPKWQPGESNGKKVRMQYSVPILLK